MNRATGRVLLFASVALGSLAIPIDAVVIPTNRPALEKDFFHPDLYVPEHQEKLGELSSSLQTAAGNELARLGVRPDSGFYDSRVGRFVSLILSEPLIPGTGRGNTLRWAGSGARPPDGVVEGQAWNAVAAFLARNRAELRLDSAEFGTPRVTVLERGSLVYVWVPRVVGGVPVRDSSIGATINHGNLVLLGLQNWGLVSTAVAPAIAPEQARAVVADHAAPFAVTFTKSPDLELIPVAPDGGCRIASRGS